MPSECTQADCPRSKTVDAEPTFTLKGSDLFAPTVIRVWIRLARLFCLPSHRIQEAESSIEAMERWRRSSQAE